jgi:hypothetical protein
VKKERKKHPGVETITHWKERTKMEKITFSLAGMDGERRKKFQVELELELCRNSFDFALRQSDYYFTSSVRICFIFLLFLNLFYCQKTSARH